MKSIFDRDFKYRPSHSTDVRKTIERARKRIEEEKRIAEENQRELDQKLQKLETRKRG